MEKLPDWNYYDCETLEMQIAINPKTNVLYTEDKIRYSPEETMILRTIDFKIPKQVHILKKLFNGILIN